MQRDRRAGAARPAQDDDAEANAIVVLATVKGDLHDLGKNMVGAMLRTSGFDVHDIGKDVSADRIVEVVRELRAADRRALARCSPPRCRTSSA